MAALLHVRAHLPQAGPHRVREPVPLQRTSPESLLVPPLERARVSSGPSSCDGWRASTESASPRVGLSGHVSHVSQPTDDVVGGHISDECRLVPRARSPPAPRRYSPVGRDRLAASARDSKVGSPSTAIPRPVRVLGWRGRCTRRVARRVPRRSPSARVPVAFGFPRAAIRLVQFPEGGVRRRLRQRALARALPPVPSSCVNAANARACTHRLSQRRWLRRRQAVADEGLAVSVLPGEVAHASAAFHRRFAGGDGFDTHFARTTSGRTQRPRAAATGCTRWAATR